MKKPWSTTIPEGSWDYIVIGSGMGGMTAAALLAKLGKRVLVLEQHYVPGGFTHTFKRPGYSWDVGVHAVGEVTRHSMTGRLLHLLTDGRLEWASLGDHYEEFYFPDDFRIDFPNHPAQFRRNLVNAFPDEEEAIDEYLAKVREVSNGMKNHLLGRLLPKALGGIADRLVGSDTQRWLQTCTADVVNALTDNPRLRAVFAAQWAYYGSVPSQSSFAIQALVVKHFSHGGYYPVGGSGRIAQELLTTVADAGGWTAIRADVDEIRISRGKAHGVQLKDGRTVEAKRVLSAAGVQSTVMRLLPEAYREQEWVHSVETLRPSKAHVCLYLGFKGDVRAAGAGSANQWFYKTWNMEEDLWRFEDENAEAPCLYVSFGSLKNPLHDPGPEERHTGEIITFVPYDAFEKWMDTRWKKRGAEYDQLKNTLTQRLLRQFFKHRPDLEPLLDFAELSTPASTEHFVRPVRGSIYGIEPTPERFANPWLRPRSPVKNLFFGGSDVVSVGVIGAMMGGVLSATTAEPTSALRLLRNVIGRRA
ncbi:MAG: NAD(P)/FAD-dependent oxidoreductase [Myxococcota bacterium]